METEKQKFASQADPATLAALRSIAKSEGKQFQAVLDEAMRDFIEKKQSGKARKHVAQALHESISEFGELYKKLAE